MKNKKEKILVAKISGIDMARAAKPYYVPGFRCGAHMGKKDRPRDKNWRNWDSDS